MSLKQKEEGEGIIPLLFHLLTRIREEYPAYGNTLSYIYDRDVRWFSEKGTQTRRHGKAVTV